MLKVQLREKNQIIEIEDVTLRKGEGANYNIIGYQEGKEIELISIASKEWAEGIMNNMKNALQTTQSEEVFKFPDINAKEFDVW